MKPKKNYTVFIIVGALIAAAIIAYLLFKKPKQPATKPLGVGVDSSDPSQPPVEPSDLEDEEDSSTEPIPSEIKTLDFIDNDSVKSYLIFLLTPAQQLTLKTWVQRIIQEKITHPEAWQNANGLNGQVSDIGHALYQMKVWNADILSSLKSKQ